MTRAVDISNWQGNYLDYNELRDNGVTAVWVRLGYRGYLYATIKKDDGFDSNIETVKNAGMKAMLYFLPQSITEDEVREEARFCINEANAKGIQHIAYDSENGDAENGTGRADEGKLSKEDRTYLLNCFTEECCNAGKTPWLYCNKYWLFNNFNVDDIDSRVKYWIAGYVSECPDIGRDVHMWQYTNSFLGQSLDCSECYVDLDNVDDYNGSGDNNMTRQQARNCINTCFIEQLGRLADPEALEAYTNAIIDRDYDCDLSDVDNALKDSDEYRIKHKREFIINCYRTLLGRDPESEDVIEARMGYALLRDIYTEIVNSEEYQNMHN